MGRKNCIHSSCINPVSDKVVVANHLSFTKFFLFKNSFLFGHFYLKIGSSVHKVARNDSKIFLSDECVDDRWERL